MEAKVNFSYYQDEEFNIIVLLICIVIVFVLSIDAKSWHPRRTYHNTRKNSANAKIPDIPQMPIIWGIFRCK